MSHPKIILCPRGAACGPYCRQCETHVCPHTLAAIADGYHPPALPTGAEPRWVSPPEPNGLRTLEVAPDTLPGGLMTRYVAVDSIPYQIIAIVIPSPGAPWLVTVRPMVLAGRWSALQLLGLDPGLGAWATPLYGEVAASGARAVRTTSAVGWN